MADHVCGHSRLVNMRTPARLTGLRGENAPLVTPVGAAAPGGAVYKAVTMATTDSYVTAEIAFPAD
ncbi:hypothetical protein [Mycobacterium sp. E2479]|uniref:hypothetical protein n=1 Tax=Mycobacterium sp. E2479 TaxID=1834134 RepID=UPI0012EAADA4|nr:hypothetical protein [Mycobacterium sp. E2479]